MQFDDTSITSFRAHTQSVDSKLLYAELLKYGGYRQGAIRRLSASQLTPTWLKNNGTFRPVLIPAPSEDNAAVAAFVKTPAGGITAETLVTSLGPTVPVHTFDSPTQQEGPVWTLHQWKIYWNKKTARQTPSNKAQDGAALHAVAADATAALSKPSDLPLEGIDKDYLTRLLCLPTLPITGTPLEPEISAPPAVQAVDLRTSLGVIEATPQAKLPIMLGMYPNKSFVNSTMAPGGASVWIYLVTGTATIAVSPPVAKNLATYAAWACGGKDSGIFLPSKCEGSSKAELTAGDTLILPPGYTFTLAVTSSAIILSGGVLRSDSLGIHLDAVRIEEAAGVGIGRQYPEFRQLMWRTASKYAALLGEKVKNKMENFEEKVASRVLQMEREDRTVAAKAAARARAQAAAAAAKAASRPSSAAGAAVREGPGGRRRKRHADDFIQSDSDWSGGIKGDIGDDDDDDEGEWVPGARQHRGKADSEDNSGEEREGDDVLDSDAEQMDLEYRNYDDDLDGRYGETRKKRGKRGTLGTIGGGVTGERQSKRQRARRGEAEDVASGVASVRPVAALNLVGVPPSSLKLKLKITSTTAANAFVEQQPKRSPIKLTIKCPAAPPPPPAATIPQVDGPGDDSIEQLELSEGEEQGLPALYLTLRRWLRDSPADAAMASSALQNNQNPWTVLARFELALKGLKLVDVSDDEEHPPPVCVNLSAVSRDPLEPTGAPYQEKLTIDGRGGEHEGGDTYGGCDRDSMDDQSGDNAALIDERDIQKGIYYEKKGGGGSGGNRPGSAMAAAGSGGKVASNGGGLGGGGDDTTAARERSHAPGTARATPGRTGGPLSKTAAAKLKKLSTKDRLKKKLGL
ncbi:hypothetical protein Ndes2526B_g03217 [Nannochloris sp. 'desiccata']|nr:hypothetical protein KSW81_006557 [Chlorella desiccata (nom. nud.)]